MNLHRGRIVPWLGAVVLATAGFILAVESAAAAPRREAAVFAPPTIDVAGDFNEDSNPDLLWQHSPSGNLKVTLMSGVAPMEDVAIEPGAGDASLVVVGTDDFDGDDRTDILFWHPSDGMLAVWHMDGVRLIYKSELRQREPEYTPVSVLDYDRDGNPDILFQRRTSHDQIVVWLLQGTEVVAKAPVQLNSFELGWTWSVVGSSDFDGDGDPDLLLYSAGSPMNSRMNVAVAVAFMDGGVGTVTLVTEFGDRNWLLRSTADFSRDGFPDLIWENFMTGDIGMWEMEGARVKSTRIVASRTTLERCWHIVGPR